MCRGLAGIEPATSPILESGQPDGFPKGERYHYATVPDHLACLATASNPLMSRHAVNRRLANGPLFRRAKICQASKSNRYAFRAARQALRAVGGGAAQAAPRGAWTESYIALACAVMHAPHQPDTPPAMLPCRCDRAQPIVGQLHDLGRTECAHAVYPKCRGWPARLAGV